VSAQITTSEAARRLEVPPAALYRAIAAGELPAARTETGRVVVRLADARRVLDLDDVASDPLDEVEQRARAASDDLERRDAAIVAAYAADKSLAEIARRAGLSVEGVRQVLDRAGVKLRPRGRRRTTR
jgi:excisionase family DNA binding protein